MPECKQCAHVGATADFRRSPTSGYLCNDKAACERRRHVKLSPWPTMYRMAEQLATGGDGLRALVGSNETLASLEAMRDQRDRWTALVYELVLAAAREGHKQKDIAAALDVPPSYLRGLKQEAAA